MQITVQFGAQARVAAGIESERVSVAAGTSLRALLVQVAQSHGDALRQLMLDGDANPRRSIMILLGDEMVRPGDPRPLNENASITILSPIAGG